MKNITLLFFAISFCANAQNGGKTVFNFLNHPTSARITALGGVAIAIKEQDVALAWTNPAVLNKDMSGQISFNYDALFQGVGSSFVAYSQHSNKLNMTFHSGLQYLNYGTFNAADETGTQNGTFDAKDFAFGIGAARPLSEKWSMGLNLKFMSSNLESYSASGLSSDVSAMYYNADKKLGFTILAKNAGTQLSTYTASPRGNLPFEIQMGFSKQLKHLPFRFSFVAKDLQRWNITYKDPNVVEDSFIPGEEVKETPAFVKQLDNLARHLGVNGEFLLGKNENLRLRFGYNYLLKKELNVSPYRSLTGFSFGLGFKVSKFRIDFGRSIQHLAGGFSHFSLSTNFNEFRKKK